MSGKPASLKFADRPALMSTRQAGHLWFEHVRLRQLEAAACAYPQVKAAIADQDLVWRRDLFTFSCKTAANTNKCQVGRFRGSKTRIQGI
jgi:hypothetical protein